MLLVRYLHAKTTCNFKNLNVAVPFTEPIIDYRKEGHAYLPTDR